MYIYTLQPDSLLPAYKVLCKDDAVINCPFQAPLMMQDELRPQATKLKYRGCGTWCALFRNKNGIVTQGCAKDDSPMKLSEEKKELTLHPGL